MINLKKLQAASATNNNSNKKYKHAPTNITPLISIKRSSHLIAPKGKHPPIL